MKIKKTVGMAIVAVALVLGTVATWHWYSDKTVLTQSQCGKVQLASMNWASAEFMASVDKFILEEGYGCNVEVVPGATETTFASMNDKGKPDVAPELWANAFIDAARQSDRRGPPDFCQRRADCRAGRRLVDHAGYRQKTSRN